jgi:SAM-dependent methyltransferase
MSSDRNYQTKLKNEIAHYQDVFKNTLLQKVPDSWNLVEHHFSQRIKRQTGTTGVAPYIGRYFQGRRKIELLGLGSGACGPELEGIVPELKKNNINVRLSCLDINRSALNIAAKEATKRKVTFKKIVVDINRYRFPKNKFDVIVAYASLHHFDNLDHVTKGICQSLKPNGIFITIDIPTKNGYLMWPETYRLVSLLWQILPPQFKIDHTKHAQPTFAPNYENIDYSKTSFECQNSEKILFYLKQNLKQLSYVPGMSISRRFFDTKFGPNYNIRRVLDKSIINFILHLDDYLLDRGYLKPETFFGVYKKI